MSLLFPPLTTSWKNTHRSRSRSRNRPLATAIVRNVQPEILKMKANM
jgi:hypothetical protein